MPYVQDSKVENQHVPVIFDSVTGRVDNHGLALLRERRRDQYGWRSKGEREAATAALAATQASANWSDTRDVIAAMDRVERSMTDPLIRDQDRQVNDRNYTDRITINASPKIKVYRDGEYRATFNPVLSTDFQLRGVPDPPTDNTMRTIGGDLLRASRPTSPASNLTQWFGELRQFSSGFSVPTKMPDELWNKPGLRGEIARFRQGGRQVGSGYLAGQFGWIPFFGEVFDALEAVRDSEAIIDQFLRDSGKLVKRTRERPTYNVASSSTDWRPWGRGTTMYHSQHRAHDGIAYVNRFAKNWTTDRFTIETRNTVIRKEGYRVGALWEFFAADPEGAVGRLKKFSQEARLLLGDPLLSASTLWELAPWSWLVDWRFDLGGLLSFQESVADDSLAARRSYVVWEQEVSVLTHWRFVPPPTYTLSVESAMTTLTQRRQRRRAGTPYDMGIDWSGFSSQQWFILGALGLTKAPGKKL